MRCAMVALLLTAVHLTCVGCASTVRSKLRMITVGMSAADAIAVLRDGAAMMHIDSLASPTMESLVGVGVSTYRADVVMEMVGLTGGIQVSVVRRHYGMLGLGRDTVCLVIGGEDILLGHVAWHDN